MKLLSTKARRTSSLGSGGGSPSITIRRRAAASPSGVLGVARKLNCLAAVLAAAPPPALVLLAAVSSSSLLASPLLLLCDAAASAAFTTAGSAAVRPPRGSARLRNCEDHLYHRTTTGSGSSSSSSSSSTGTTTRGGSARGGGADLQPPPANNHRRSRAASLAAPAAAAAVLAAISGSIAPAPAQAFDPSVYSGDYRDPLHPLCERHVRVSKDKRRFQYFGTDVGPKGWSEKHGCSQEEIERYGLRQGAFEGRILENERLSVGDGVHEAAWEPAGDGSASTNGGMGYTDVDGIRFDDGNKWVRYGQSMVVQDPRTKQNVVKSKGLAVKVGEFAFLSYVGVSVLAGLKWLYEKTQMKVEQQ